MRLAVGCVLLALVVSASCGRREEPAEEAGAEHAAARMAEVREPGLPPEAAPIRVAQALFAALDAEDEPALRGLAAGRAITDDLNRLGRGRMRMNEREAVEMAISGWQLTYAFVEKGSTTVTEERIDDDRGSAFADCRNAADGRPRRLEVELVRGASGWRVFRLVPR